MKKTGVLENTLRNHSAVFSSFQSPNYVLTVDESARIADPPADARGRQAEVFFLSAAFRAKQLCSASVPQTPASAPRLLERFPAAQPRPAVENVPSQTKSGDAHRRKFSHNAFPHTCERDRPL